MSRRRRKRDSRVSRWAGKQTARLSAASSESAEDAQPEEGASGRRSRLIALGGLVLAVPVIALLAWFVFFGGDDGPAGPPRAVIVDQLSLTFPNEAFVEEATSKLQQAGYEVDYFAGEDVTVDLYRHLPEQDYDVVIYRAHSARIQGEFRGKQLDETVLFTNEPYQDADPNDPKTYFDEQVEARLDIAYTHVGAPEYFGITADFVEFSMKGNLDDALVIMMGCEGLASDRTAEAFTNLGADNYISWSDTVSASHTDASTSRLLDFLLVDDLSPEDAVAQTVAELGPDPTYDSILRNYSSEG